MAVTFCTSGDVVLAAGINAITLKDTEYTTLINQAESAFNVAAAIVGINLVTTYATLNTDVKKILEDGAASHAAIAVIRNDMSGFTSREAETLLDVNYTRYNDAVKLIRDKKGTDFMQDA